MTPTDFNPRYAVGSLIAAILVIVGLGISPLA
jgi:hypothetical protein